MICLSRSIKRFDYMHLGNLGQKSDLKNDSSKMKITISKLLLTISYIVSQCKCELTCGKSIGEAKSHPKGRIVEGQNADEHEYPWAVFLVVGQSMVLKLFKYILKSCDPNYRGTHLWCHFNSSKVDFNSSSLCQRIFS